MHATRPRFPCHSDMYNGINTTTNCACCSDCIVEKEKERKRHREKERKEEEKEEKLKRKRKKEEAKKGRNERKRGLKEVLL